MFHEWLVILKSFSNTREQLKKWIHFPFVFKFILYKWLAVSIGLISWAEGIWFTCLGRKIWDEIMQHYKHYNSQSINTLKHGEAFIGRWARLSLIQMIACRLLHADLSPEPFLICCELNSYIQNSEE